MSPDHRAQLVQALWPAGQARRLGVWGILDGAREPSIYRALLASRLEFRCLFSGRLPRALEMVAPQLVELPPGHRLVDTWLDEGWGQSWGVFVKIDDPSNLRHHLRKFLSVRDERERRMLFRYFDPRVLRAFLPGADSAQVNTLFGPIEAWLAEDGVGDLVEYRRNRQGGVQARPVLAAAGQEA